MSVAVVPQLPQDTFESFIVVLLPSRRITLRPKHKHRCKSAVPSPRPGTAPLLTLIHPDVALADVERLL